MPDHLAMKIIDARDPRRRFEGYTRRLVREWRMVSVLVNMIVNAITLAGFRAEA